MGFQDFLIDSIFHSHTIKSGNEKSASSSNTTNEKPTIPKDPLQESIASITNPQTPAYIPPSDPMSQFNVGQNIYQSPQNTSSTVPEI
jgi:hypothetical protein